MGNRVRSTLDCLAVPLAGRVERRGFSTYVASEITHPNAPCKQGG
jgi:hypothetical protein